MIIEQRFINVIVFFKEGGASHALYDYDLHKFIRHDFTDLDYTVCDFITI